MKSVFLTALATVTLFVPRASLAHQRMTAPPSRNGAAEFGLTTAPCGGKASGAVVQTYNKGATISVGYNVQTSHQGCFQVALADADGAAFTVLKQTNDAAGAQNGPQTVSVALPANYTCAKCTLQLRMQDRPGGCNTDPQSTNGVTVYYSCADISIVTPSSDAGTDTGVLDSGTSSSSSGSSSSSSSGTASSSSSGAASSSGVATSSPSGSTAATTDDDSGGCSTGGNGGAFGAVALLGVASVLAAARRKRRF